LWKHHQLYTAAVFRDVFTLKSGKLPLVAKGAKVNDSATFAAFARETNLWRFLKPARG
jgi:hypothetical protein